jgi:hypothetical protein
LKHVVATLHHDMVVRFRQSHRQFYGCSTRLRECSVPLHTCVRVLPTWRACG